MLIRWELIRINKMGGRRRMVHNKWNKGGRRGRKDDVHRGKGEPMIDYVIGDREAWEKIRRLEKGSKVDSDHHL